MRIKGTTPPISTNQAVMDEAQEEEVMVLVANNIIKTLQFSVKCVASLVTLLQIVTIILIMLFKLEISNNSQHMLHNL